MIITNKIHETGDIFAAAAVDSNHQEINVIPTTTTVEHCNSCGSTKKRSLFSSSSFEQPILKKPTLSPPPPHSTAATDVVNGPLLDRFTNIKLSTNTSLRRTISEPVDSIPNYPYLSSSSSATFLNPTPPEIRNDVHSPAKNAFLSPRKLQRSISDPTPALIFPCSPENNVKTIDPVTATEIPTPPPPLRREIRRSLTNSLSSGEMGGDISIRGESPSSKELKKMKEIFKVMSEWFSKAIEEDEGEDEQEPEGSEYTRIIESPKEKDDPEPESEPETDQLAVNVARTGECLTIQFKCPCSKYYEILLSGDSCYYKLM